MIIEMENQLDEIRFDIENNNGNIDELVKRQTSLQEAFAERDGFYYKSKVKSTLTGLGFSEDEFDLCVDKLSGGQKTRVALGKILLSDANLLLLDEPTNHLDIESVEWLEDFLRNYSGAFIVISHDRYFLDRVTNKTFELENGSVSVRITEITVHIWHKGRLTKRPNREIMITQCVKFSVLKMLLNSKDVGAERKILKPPKAK